MAIITWLLANKKLIGYATAVLGLVTALYQVKSVIYDSGYNDAKIHFQSEQNKLIEQARDKYQRDIEKAMSDIQLTHDSELQRVKEEFKIVEKIKVVTEYVDKEIIVKNECDALAVDVIRVLKQSTDIVSASGPGN